MAIVTARHVLRSGERLIIHGASGAVGTLAIAEANKAHERLAAGHILGKLVLRVR